MDETSQSGVSPGLVFSPAVANRLSKAMNRFHATTDRDSSAEAREIFHFTMEPEPAPTRVSLRDIAAHLGVSHVTVSLALRDAPRVSVALRAKIKKAADEMGYRPDPMLQALAAYRGRKSKPAIHSALAWINAWPRAEDLRLHKEFDLYWKGASEGAAKLGYRLEEFRLDRQLTSQRLHRIFRARGIRGILLPPHGSLQPDWQDFPWEDYSVARFGRSLKEPQAHLVTADQFTNTLLAVNKMRERGYQRIGLIAREISHDPRGPQFIGGFLSAREQFHDIQSLPIFRFEEPVNRDRVARFRRWMDEEKPDALLSTVDHRVLLHEAGYRVPDDIPVAVTSILDGGADSGMDQHPEEIGRVGFLLLNSLINDGQRGIPKIFRQTLVEGTWVDGTSLPDRRKG
jgi:LacI family transcriptional regulator